MLLTPTCYRSRAPGPDWEAAVGVAVIRPSGAGVAEGSAEGLSEGIAPLSDLSDRGGDDEAVGAVAELIEEAGAALVDDEPKPDPNTLPTLVPSSVSLLRTGPPVSSSMPVTTSRPTRKITAVAPASNGSRMRRGERTGTTGGTTRACPAVGGAGITWVTSVEITWVTAVAGSPGRRTRATTTWRVRSSDRS